jgi:hypothetical protein
MPPFVDRKSTPDVSTLFTLPHRHRTQIKDHELFLEEFDTRAGLTTRIGESFPSLQHTHNRTSKWHGKTSTQPVLSDAKAFHNSIHEIGGHGMLGDRTGPQHIEHFHDSLQKVNHMKQIPDLQHISMRHE